MKRKIILILSLVALMLFSGCSESKPIVERCEYMGEGVKITDYEYNFNPRCLLTTTKGAYRLRNSELCDELLIDKPVLKCTKGITGYWKQEE